MKTIVNETVTLEEIAKRHSLSVKTLRRWAWERRFPLYRISNRIRVNPAEFEEWLGKFHFEGSK